VLVPMDRIAAMQTSTIRASITDYSTAVGPASEASSRRIGTLTLFVAPSLPR
jgi:hypothetical protein